MHISGNTCASKGGGIGGNGMITLGMPVQQVTVQKIWNDNNDEYGMRPTTLSVTLHRRGKAIVDGTLTEVDELIDTQQITADDNWRYTWDALDELDDSNVAWQYYVDEIDTTEDSYPLSTYYHWLH